MCECLCVCVWLSTFNANDIFCLSLFVYCQLTTQTGRHIGWIIISKFHTLSAVGCTDMSFECFVARLNYSYNYKLNVISSKSGYGPEEWSWMRNIYFEDNLFLFRFQPQQQFITLKANSQRPSVLAAQMEISFRRKFYLWPRLRLAEFTYRA